MTSPYEPKSATANAAPVTEQLGESELRTESSASSFLHALGWFFFVCGAGVAALVIITIIAVDVYEDPFALAIGIGISLAFLFAGGALTLLCYQKFWHALGAGVAVIVLFIATFTAALIYDQQVDPWEPTRADGEKSYAVIDPADLDDHYYVSTGAIDLDLSNLSPLDSARTVTAHVDTGTLNVTLPRNNPVTFSCAVKVGDSTGCEVTSLNEGKEGETLTLDLSVGIGSLEVHTADS